jgi:hypothetical protein
LTVNRITFLFAVLVFLISTGTAKETPSVPEYGATELQPLMTIHFSLLSAVHEIAMISGSLTAFRPFELGAGIFDGKLRKGYFVRAGYAVPWKENEYAMGPGMVREIVGLAGFKHAEPGSTFESEGVYYNPSNSPPKSLNAVTLELALEAVEWLNPFFGLSLHLSLGVNYWLTEWKGKPDLESIIDVSIGVAF